MNRINLALGGGGAKGFVHVGVIKALVERGDEIVSIVGTSIGAIVGSIFAYNATIAFKEDPEPQKRAVDALASLLVKEDFWQLLDVNWPSLLRRGIVKGTKIREWLDDQLVDDGSRSVRFSALPMLTVTATDMMTGECLIVNSENCGATFVSDGVRASMSIQGIFVPAPLDCAGRHVVCWDGGATGNCRFDIARRLGGELTVASSVTYRGEPRFLRTGRIRAALQPLQVADRCADIWLHHIEKMTEELLGEEVMKKIIIVRPDLDGVETMDFGIDERRRRLLIENGRAQTENQLKIFEQTHGADGP
ncbi:MAG TPA: patatin-like phospholipase family protein [Thermoanaerobaculia bacterium]|nr:patatin-like phospholipase family protein [Thermoanaerobaculia bacterium]